MSKQKAKGGLDAAMKQALSGLATCWRCPVGKTPHKGISLAGQQSVHTVLQDLITILFPGCHGFRSAGGRPAGAEMGRLLKRCARQLTEQMRRAFQYQCEFDRCRRCGDCRVKARAGVAGLLSELPAIQKVLQQDIVAAFEGDPAARSTMEVVMSYPGLFAVTVHRLAHRLYKLEVPLIPRVMSEYAHSLTGIDIHPGAMIGPGFFIDHGTGVVIGETCVIGRNVKLYQGVTLGALSFVKDSNGRLVKGNKRHPNVEDHVVIYAGATILGGETTIGAHSEIGGNVWLIHSVPPYSKVYNQQPRPLIREAGTRKTTDGTGWEDVGAGI
ncbi:MAG: hypothetical protein A2498_16415 [Lentisphaerae bacterium RIFOXYC12_FULL_60_16]|nr:MAG: hypothetical protein A2498_16415 [Lentisphaerae bacterium RIFOXYC12_FULL_60_16]OGV76721.1 MAG: hypothetical protein A2340_08225 [Lentisphaerae bacterium RIFOXYB12_FULL_60_10]